MTEIFTEEAIFKDYVFEDVPNITTFVAAHDQLESVLIEARKRIRDIFGEVEVSLEMDYWDDPKLIVNIKVDLEVQEAIDKLHQFDEGFLFPRRRGIHHFIMFDIMFI